MCSNAALRDELLAMMAKDQAMRAEMSAKYGPGEALTPDDWARWRGVDEAHQKLMRVIIAAHGWPGRSLVGRDGANAAWLLIQHADHDTEFQRHCLTLLSRAVSAGEADEQSFAYLLDRVRLHAGLTQIFGTQLSGQGGEIKPLPLIEPETVDQRRALIGLPPLAEYVAAVRQIKGGN